MFSASSSRRRGLRLALLVLGSLTSLRAQSATSPAPDPAFISTPGKAIAAPFDLSQVRLLDSVFKTDQELDRKYLLSLDPDRLVYSFRVTAGLPTSAKPYGGWEAPTCGLRGHFVGHYLSACAEMYAATGDPVLKRRGDAVVARLAQCQAALGTGYLSAFPATAFDTLETKFGGVWAPYYTIHKIMAGLVDQYHFCGNTQALDIACKMADYFGGRMARLDPATIEKVLHTSHRAPQNEYGGMSEVLHNLYAIAHKPAYLSLAQTFDRGWFLNPLAQNQDDLAGLHANTHIPQVVGFAREYELTGDENAGRAADYFWSQVTRHHSYVTGGNSKGEHFLQPGVEATALGDDTGETCNVYNMLKLTQHIFDWHADVAAADYAELAMYNHILASIEPDTGMLTYFISLQPGHFKLYCTPETAFWCCTGTGVENHAKYGESIYYHNADTLWVNLFIPSRLTWQEKGVSVMQTTRFPETDHTTLTFTAATPTRLKVRLRIPSWATQGGFIQVNGQDQPVAATPGSYATLDRTWQTGDMVSLRLPMSLHLHRAADDPNTVAILYGPLVLAGQLGRDGVPASQDSPKNNTFFNLPDPPVPALAGDAAKLSAWIKPVAGQPLAFTVATAGAPKDVRLVPFYQISHERYTVYWKLDSLADAHQ